MKKFKRALSLVLCAIMLMSLVPTAFAQNTEVERVNIALNRPATASSSEADLERLGPQGAVDGKWDNDFDERWSSKTCDAENPQWLQVDLGEGATFQEVKINWEASYATKYKIQYSNDENDENAWTDAVVVTDNNSEGWRTHQLAEPVTARYLRVYATERGGAAGSTISIFEIQVFEQLAEKPLKNLAQGKTATASSKEADLDRLGPQGAVDGKWSDIANDRWSSKTCNAENPQWLQVDLGEPTTFQAFRINWEDSYATKYKIQYSNDANDWTDAVVATNDRSGWKAHLLDEPVTAQYVRIYATERGGAAGSTISIWEFQVLENLPDSALSPEEMADVLQQKLMNQLNSIDLTTAERMPTLEVDGMTAKFYCCSIDTLIADDGTIQHRPLQDKNIAVTYHLMDSTGEKIAELRDIPLTFPGSANKETGDNEKPTVIPAMQEWKGAQGGAFKLSADSKIIVSDTKNIGLEKIAEIVKADVKELFNYDLTVASGSPKAGDIVLTTDGADATLGEQGYTMTVGEYVTVAGNAYRGVFFGTRSVLQALVSSGNQTIAKGTAVDYPNYPVRKEMIDVSRIYLPMWYLQDLVKYASWLKISDIQVHLSDVSYRGHTGFRLESDIPSLTSKDGYYTKDEYRQFQDMAADHGIVINSEFDTPAHSTVYIDLGNPEKNPDHYKEYEGLGLPDGTHFDLVNPENRKKVDAFMLKLLEEYLGGENPVFRTDLFDIGTDEYPKEHWESMKSYTAFLTETIQKKYGKTVCGWNSPGFLSDDITPEMAKNVNIDLWGSHVMPGAEKGSQELFDRGYNIINADVYHYVIPGSGTVNGINMDWRGAPIYNRNPWQFSYGGSFTRPQGDPQILGGSQSTWNDTAMWGGVPVYEVFLSQKETLPSIAQVYWSGREEGVDYNAFTAKLEMVSDGPGMKGLNQKISSKTNKVYALDMEEMVKTENGLVVKDHSGNGYDVNVVGATQVGANNHALAFDGDDYITTSHKVLAFPNTLAFDFKMNPEQTGTVNLFYAKMPEELCSSQGTNTPGVGKITTGYEEMTISLVPQENGNYRLAYHRDGSDYTHNYEFEKGKAYNVAFQSDRFRTYLYVNGELVSTLLKKDNYVVADEFPDAVFDGAMGIPMERIGEGLMGTMDNIQIYNEKIGTGDLFPANAAAPEISAQPQGGEYIVDKNAEEMKVEASVADNGSLSFQWYENSTESVEGGKAIEGATSASYKPSTAKEGTTYYYCVVTNTNLMATAQKTAQTVSQIAKITVTKAPEIPAADKTQLQETIAKAEGMDLTGYTAESVEAFKSALQKAKDVMADETLTKENQAVVDEAVNLLQAAIDGLKKEENKPDTNKPDTNKPDTNKPDTNKPDANKPDANKPDANKPDANKPDASKPDASKPDASKPEANKPEANKPEANKPEANKPASGSPQTGDDALVVVMSVMALVSMMAVVILRKKIKDNDNV